MTFFSHKTTRLSLSPSLNIAHIYHNMSNVNLVLVCQDQMWSVVIPVQCSAPDLAVGRQSSIRLPDLTLRIIGCLDVIQRWRNTFHTDETLVADYSFLPQVQAEGCLPLIMNHPVRLPDQADVTCPTMICATSCMVNQENKTTFKNVFFPVKQSKINEL